MTSSTTDAKVTAVVERARELGQRAVADGVVGLGLGIVADGRVVMADGFGLADVAAATPVTASTSFRIGSVTKTFTALAVLSLVETGAIGLDDPIGEHLRSVRIRAARGSRPITVRDMLTHTSGLGEMRSPRELLARRIPFVVDDGQPVPALAEFYRRGLRADTPAGRRWSYSNHAFACLGQLVADVTHRPYGDYVGATVLGPLDMSATTLEPDATTLATGYMDAADGTKTPVPYQHIVIAPAGAYHSTLTDMLRYAAWLASGGTSRPGPVTPTMLETAFARHFEPDLRLPGFGLGFGRDDIGPHRVVTHDGGFPGFSTAMSVMPDARVGIVIWSNAISGAPRRISDALVRELLPIDESEADAVPAPRAIAERIAGRYRPLRGWNSNLRWRGEYGRWLDVRLQDGTPTLWSRRGPFARGIPLRLHSRDDDLFWVGTAERIGIPFPVRLRFVTDEKGRVRGCEGVAHTHVVMQR